MKKGNIGSKPVLASTVSFRGARVFNDAGELNAASKSDALAMIAQVAAQLSAGDNIVTESEAETAATTRAERREVLAAIINDKTGETARTVGAEMAGTINESINREGLMRQLCQYAELEQGERPEVYVQQKEVVAAVMTGPTQAQLQVVRDNVIFPQEVDITERLIIEQRQINSTREDLLQRKYNEGLEAVMVGEDRMFKKACDALISKMGQQSLHAGANITTGAIESGISMITGFNLPLQAILFASNLWANMATNRDFENLIDPVSRLEIIRTGKIGQLWGADVLTDGVREPNLKVLDSNEIYYFASPEYLGEYTDRGGVQSVPLGPEHTGINGAGWHIAESLSLAIVNHRAVAKTLIG